MPCPPRWTGSLELHVRMHVSMHSWGKNHRLEGTTLDAHTGHGEVLAPTERNGDFILSRIWGRP